MMKQLTYLGALFAANWKAHYLQPKRVFLLGGFMLVQNLMFFLLWVVFFHAVGNVRGWRLEDVALMYGSFASAVGLSLFIGDGARTLAFRLQDGSLDGYLTRPRHPLIPLILSRSNVASLGDMLSGPALWALFSDLPAAQFLPLIVFVLLAAVIFSAMLVLFYSLAFWLQRSGRFSDQLYEMFIIISVIPQHSQSLSLKVVMFSVLPAGFVSFLPVSLFRVFDPLLFAVLVAAAFIYVWLAAVVFSAGVKRYVSSGGC